MSEDRDPILDACLDEVLGGLAPPDLSQRILYELSRRSSNGAANASATADEILPPVCDTPLVQPRRSSVDQVVAGGSRKARRDYNAIAWASVGVALGVIALISVTGILIKHRRDRDEIAKQQPESSSQTVGNASANGSQNSMPELPTVVFDLPKLDKNSPVPPTPEVRTETPTVPVPVGPPATPSPAIVIARTPLPTALSDDEIVGRINSAIRSQWTANKLTAPAFISSQDWQRRVFRVVLGREPTEEESKKFSSGGGRSRSELLTALTTSNSYVDQFARRWSEILTDAYLSPDELAGGSPANREGMLQYFRRALLDRRPFDRVATELLTATGSGVPGDAAYNGAANFLLARAGGRLEHATADTARMFLGRSVDCQQCHADPRDQQRGQQEFWELNTFFRQLAVVRTPNSTVAKLSDVDFLGEDQKDGRNASVFYELPDGVLKVASPAFRGQVDLPKSGLVAEVNRRELLAQCVAESPEFRQATANRLWSAVMGQGLVPVDDLQAGDSAYRGLLNDLADQFAAHQFDPRQLITWAVLSEPFSVPDSDLLPMAHFQRFQLQQPGQRATTHESLLAAAKSFGQLNTNAATTAKVDATPKNISKNGKAIEPANPSRSLIGAGATHTPRAPDALALRILADQKLSAKQKADHLFLLVLHRQPRQHEMQVVEQLLQQSGQKPEAAWNAVWNAIQ